MPLPMKPHSNEGWGSLLLLLLSSKTTNPNRQPQNPTNNNTDRAIGQTARTAVPHPPSPSSTADVSTPARPADASPVRVDDPIPVLASPGHEPGGDAARNDLPFSRSEGGAGQGQ